MTRFCNRQTDEQPDKLTNNLTNKLTDKLTDKLTNGTTNLYVDVMFAAKTAWLFTPSNNVSLGSCLGCLSGCLGYCQFQLVCLFFRLFIKKRVAFLTK